MALLWYQCSGPAGMLDEGYVGGATLRLVRKLL